MLLSNPLCQTVCSCYNFSKSIKKLFKTVNSSLYSFNLTNRANSGQLLTSTLKLYRSRCLFRRCKSAFLLDVLSFGGGHRKESVCYYCFIENALMIKGKNRNCLKYEILWGRNQLQEFTLMLVNNALNIFQDKIGPGRILLC